MLPVLFLVLVFAPLVLADSKSDYDYQYGQYRINYAEFLVLKQDYLDTPSLDNQQKAMISAKQTILARDLAKASMDGYLMDLIAGYKVNYPGIQPIINLVGTSRSYFLDQSQKSQAIITREDLKKFTDNYLKTVTDNDVYIKLGIIANKIANLVRIQEDMKIALQDLLPRLASPMPASLTERLGELQTSITFIDGKISQMAIDLNDPNAILEAPNDIFFNARIEKLNEIRTLELDWINKLIDIDINYGQV